MKRISEKILLREICTDANIVQSIHQVVRGKRRKNSPLGRKILHNIPEYVKLIKERIKKADFGDLDYYEMFVKDGPKIRKVQVVNLVNRIAVNAVMSVVEKYVFKRYIRTTGASIKNRGAHDLLSIVINDIQKNIGNLNFIYASDYTKFYENISQDIMMYSLERMFKGKTILKIFNYFVRMMPSGISIGLRSSQAFGNILISMHVDHYVKDGLGLKFYYRYCDDIRKGDKTKKPLWRFSRIMHDKADYMHLPIKANERIFPVWLGVNFLGYIIYPTHVVLRKRTKKRFAIKMKRVKSKRRRYELTASFYGACKHANCKNIFKILTGISMKEFKDLGIKPKYKDGKKRFQGTNISLKELVGRKIEVHDYETGVITTWMREEYKAKYDKVRDNYNNLLKKFNGKIPDDVDYEHPDSVEKPEGRYVVQIKIVETGEMRKFFTGDKEMWSILDQIAENPDGFPFLTTITSERYGNNNGVRYLFS